MPSQEFSRFLKILQLLALSFLLCFRNGP